MYGDDPEKKRIGRGNFYSQYDRRTIHQAAALNSAQTRWVAEPSPAEPYRILTSFALA